MKNEKNNRVIQTTNVTIDLLKQQTKSEMSQDTPHPNTGKSKKCITGFTQLAQSR